MEDEIKNLVNKVFSQLSLEKVNFSVEHPEDFKNGDYSTNVAMVYAKIKKTNPRELAQKISEGINKNLSKGIERVDVAGAGFINFYLSPEFFTESVGKVAKEKGFGRNDALKGKKTIVEYTDPNPFKEFHIGHLSSNTTGESISRLIEWSGAEVKRACYQGDVGLHVAKAIYGFQKTGDWKKAYAYGAKAYEKDEEAKKEIEILNKKIYEQDPEIMPIYKSGKEKSLKSFEEIYQKLGTKFDFYFFESEVVSFGKEVVEKNMGKVFDEGEGGAIIYKGERSGLHTRVFINKEGIPTYEAKELGLAKIKNDQYPYDKSIIITGNEIDEYFRVLLSAMAKIFPKLEEKTIHLSHGMLKFAFGKMSSRLGNIITAEDLINEVKNKVKGQEEVAIGAIKYMILRQAVGGDIIFDIEKSVSTEGDSGVYLQYSYARARSILKKAKSENIMTKTDLLDNWQITEMERLIYRFPEVVLRSAQEFSPHYIVNFLTELARAFNSFYGNNQIVDKGDKNSPYKIVLTEAFSIVMKNGLHLLGIQAPEKM